MNHSSQSGVLPTQPNSSGIRLHISPPTYYCMYSHQLAFDTYRRCFFAKGHIILDGTLHTCSIELVINRKWRKNNSDWTLTLFRVMTCATQGFEVDLYFAGLDVSTSRRLRRIEPRAQVLTSPLLHQTSQLPYYYGTTPANPQGPSERSELTNWFHREG